MQIFTNNISTTVNTLLTAGATTLIVDDATGMPSPTGAEYFLLTLFSLNGNGQEDTWEIVKVTSRSGNSLTIVRAQEGTTAVEWAVATTCQMRATAGSFDAKANAADLTNVDNTSDVNKPISTLQQTALDAKQATLVSSTNIKSINGISLLGSGDLTVGSNIVRSSQTGTYTVLLADNSKLIDWSGSSDNTLSFTAVATLGSGWFCYVRNSGTADLTLNPSGVEQIDGLTTFKMYPGESRLIQCDGSILRSIVLSAFSKTFTASGTFTKPPGYKQFGGLLWSGGGGGSRNTESTGAGGGGGCMPITVSESSIGTTESITIGTGGAGRTVSTGAGSAGGNSTAFGLTINGGGGGGTTTGAAGGSVSTAGTADASEAANGFEGTNSTSNVARSAVYGGGGGGYVSGGAGTAGGDSAYGGAGGGGVAAGSAAAGGTSVFGGNGGAGSDSSTASSGTAPGGGGGAGRNNNGGNGARGELQIWGIT